MIPLQRVFTVLMAAAMIFVFLVPLALRRHDYRLVVVLVVVFAGYLALNAWIAMRMRKNRLS